MEDVFLPTIDAHDEAPVYEQDLPRFEDLSDPIHNRMRKSPYYGQKIILRSVFGKTAGPAKIEPTHPRGQDHVWLGVPNLTAQEKRAGMYQVAVPGLTFIQIQDGYEVDCGTEKGLYDWEWMQYAPQIVQNRADTDYNPEKPHEGADSEFYIVVPNFEEAKAAKTFDQRREAMNYVAKLSPVGWYQLARLLGANMENSNSFSVYNYLQGIADKKPERILLAKDEENASVRLLFLKLEDAGIIRKTEGVYKYNDKVLGTSEKQVVYNMCLKEHASIVRFMRNDLGVKTLGLPVDSPYVSYASADSQAALAAQAAQPSSVMETIARINAKNNVAPAAEEEDDYVDEEDEEVETFAPQAPAKPTSATAPTIPAPEAPTAPTTVAGAAKRNTSGLKNQAKGTI